MRNWHHVDRLVVDMGNSQRPYAEFYLLPGKTIRIDTLSAFQPAVVFRGSGRITFAGTIPTTGETVVTIDPIGNGGGLDVRFDKWVYALVRLFVMPLDDMTLREVRFARVQPPARLGDDAR